MKRARLIGERTYLRPFEKTDLSDDYLDWMNDPSVINNILGATRPVTRATLERYLESLEADPSMVMFAACTIEDDLHIGNARISHIDMQNRRCRYGRIIGHPEYRGRGYGSDILIQLLRYGVHHLGMNRMWTAVASQNQGSIKSNEKVGMVKEGLLREFIWANGQFHDAWAISMLRQEFYERYGQADPSTSTG